MLFSLNGRASVQLYGCVSHKNGSWHSGRRIDKHLMLYVTEGEVHMRIGGGKYHAVPGDLLFIPRGTFYRPVGRDGCTYCFFHFSLEEAGEVQPQAPAVSALEEGCEGFAYFIDDTYDTTVDLAPHITPSDPQAMEDILRRVSRLDVANDAGQKRLLDLYFRELLVSIASAGHKVRGNGTAERIVHYILAHIRTPLSLDDIATAFYLSPSYVARVFKKEMGEGVGTYITRQKINLACAMLINTDISVSEVARQTGFSNQYYFSTVFSKWMGLTPTAYRNRGTSA